MIQMHKCTAGKGCDICLLTFINEIYGMYALARGQANFARREEGAFDMPRVILRN